MLVALTFQACNVTHLLDKGEVLITKNKVKGVNSDEEEEMKYLLRPKPNKKFLRLVRLNLWVYEIASKGKTNRLKNYLLKNIGEKPSLYDQDQLDQTQQQLLKYLYDHGYYNARIEQIVTKISENKVAVTFQCYPGIPYTITELNWFNESGEIGDILTALKEKSLINPGQPLSRDMVDEERQRITDYLRSKGYFYFKKDYIYFDADTISEKGKAKLTAHLKSTTDSNIYSSFSIGNIYINTNFDPVNPGNFTEGNRIYVNGFEFQANEEMYIRPDVIISNILFRKGEAFNENQIRQTQLRLGSLSAFSYINIRLEPLSVGGTNLVNVQILLSKATKLKLGIDASGSSNSGTVLGILVKPTIENRNLFRGAETFTLSLNGGLESQQINLATTNNGLFNTAQIGGSAVLSIPRFGFPFRFLNSKNFISEKSRVQANYNQQKRSDYDRSVLSGAYLFDAKVNKKVQVTLYLVEVNLVKTNRIGASLMEVLQKQNDPYLNFMFTNHLTTDTRLTFTYDNLNSDSRRKRWFFRGNAETAGNLLYLAYPLINETSSFPKTIFGLPFFHYLRFDGDLRKYYHFGQDKDFVLRGFVGVGIPLSNSTTLPLEKRYFSGGNTSIRAWTARAIGPGGFNSYNTKIDYFGDMKLELNAEYRFPIFGMFKGAVFCDAGNIWTFKDTFSGRKDFTNFKLNQFYKQLAIGSGLGLRMDFTYFLVRFDIGVKIYDPAFTSGNRWVIRHFFGDNWDDVGWKTQLIGGAASSYSKYNFFGFNLGVNYPF